MIGYYITFCPKSKEKDLKHMASNGSMLVQAIVYLNKVQRYQCLRKLLIFEVEGVEELFEKEQKRDFSDVDVAQKMRFDAARPETASKEAMLKSFTEVGKWK